MAESIGNLPFEEFIRFLNGGYYLDTFEVGSIKIDPISWPNSSRDRKPKQQSDIVDEILTRPWIDPKKFSGRGFEKSPIDEGIAKTKVEPDLLPIRKTNKITCARIQTQNVSKKEDDCSCKVKKMKKVSISNSPENMGSKEERKLEGTKRKMRERYEGIAKTKVEPDLLPIRKTNKITCARIQTQNVGKKEDDCSCKVKKMVKKVSVSNSPENMDSKEERKLESTKRKMRERYEVIENEKKKRRVQIIDFLKPQPPCVQPLEKKQRRKKISFP